MLKFFRKFLLNEYLDNLREETEELVSYPVSELDSPQKVRAYLKELTLKKLTVKSAPYPTEQQRWQVLYLIDDKFDEVNLLCDEENLNWSTQLRSST